MKKHSHSVVYIHMYTPRIAVLSSHLYHCAIKVLLHCRPPARTHRNTSTLSCCKPHLMGFSVIFWSSRVRVSKDLGMKMVWHALGLSPPGPLSLIWLSRMQERVTWGHCERHAWLAHNSARLLWIEGQLFRKLDMKWWNLSRGCDVKFPTLPWINGSRKSGDLFLNFLDLRGVTIARNVKTRLDGWTLGFWPSLHWNTVICAKHMYSLFQFLLTLLI